MGKPKVFTTLFGLLATALVIAAGVTYSWYSARAQAASCKTISNAGGIALGSGDAALAESFCLKATLESHTANNVERSRPITLTPGEYQDPPFRSAGARCSSSPFVIYPGDMEGEDAVSVISFAVENNASVNIIAQINLKGAPWESDNYETAVFPADSWELSPYIAYYQLKEPATDMTSGFIPYKLKSDQTYNPMTFYRERCVDNKPENTGVHIKSFMGIGKYNADKTKIDFCYKPAFKKMSEHAAGDDYLYAYMPVGSVAYIAYELYADDNASTMSNLFQYAVYALPLTASGGLDSDGNPLLTAFGSQAHEAAVDGFFGSGTFAVLKNTIMPPS